VSTLQLEYSEDELLADDEFEAPLVVNGVRCHGGFDASGAYVSPRGRHRRGAIAAWEEHRLGQFGTPIIDVPLDTWPEPFPNVAQSKLLLRHGVTGPTVTQLTRIGTVEGFGGFLRLLPVPDLERCFDEDITGTALAHIPRGLLEAHARDESGFEGQAGHDTMWFAARDVAFEGPPTEDLTARMLGRMGLSGTPRTDEELRALREAALANRALPDDIDFALESLVTRMVSLLLIEISAFHGFAWAEAVLSDTGLVAGDGEAARLVACIRADETPHVDWLRTALSEMRDRTWVGGGGRRHPGTEMIGKLWDRAMRDTLLLRRRENLAFAMGEIEASVAGRPDADDLVEELLSLGTVVRLPDGTVADADGDHPLG
jgi:hypothetical protein